jgi:hypothetical protein
MKYFIINAIALISGLIYSPQLSAQKSATGRLVKYREICERASTDPELLKVFRSLKDYAPVLECGQEGEFAEYLKNNALKSTMKKKFVYQKLDTIGNPVMNYAPGLGMFSGTTLRYIWVADHIKRLFKLPHNAKVAEIGAGFGGQCYIFSKINQFSKYYFYDLPEVELLIATMMKKLSVKNTQCMHMDANLPEESIDLLISNYALSECYKETQMSYFHRVVKKSLRGYMLYNKSHGYTANEFFDLLQSHGMNPKILEEPVFSYTGNVLLIWDKTKA